MAPRLRTWLQLFRAPNLFTVPGDPLAGFLLASGGSLRPAVLTAIAASLALYCAGLLLNDLCDLAEDRAERPHRPLPSGAAEPRVVRAVAILLLLFGNACALALGTHAALVAIGLSAAVVAYDLGAKRLVGVGALVMGLCRGLSLVLGAAAATEEPVRAVFLAAGMVTLYIAAVTHLARYETHATAPAWARALPPIPLAIGVIASLGQGGPAWQYPGPATLALAFVLAGSEARHLLRHPASPLPPAIGRLIRALLIVQSALCLMRRPSPSAFLCALLLLALWPVSRAVSRRFYAS
jgi:4-hydroxybenzoate polyprenyltransferase